MRIGPEPLRTDANAFQQVERPRFAPLGTAGGSMRFQGVEQMLSHGHQRIQPRHRVLKHQTSRLSAQLTQGGAIQLARVLSGEFQPPFAGGAHGKQLHHRPRHRAFATSRRPH